MFRRRLPTPGGRGWQTAAIQPSGGARFRSIRSAVVKPSGPVNDESMSTSSLPAKAVTLLAVLATLGVLGWAKWIWLRRWWDAINHPGAGPGALRPPAPK
jgi:hypothetical protein